MKRDKKWFIIAAFLLSITSAFGYGYKLNIEAQGPYKLYFVDESLLPNVEGHTYEAGNQELLFQSDAEYIVLLLSIPTGALIRIEIFYLDSEGEALPGKPTRFVVEGVMGGLRIKHPHWMPQEA